MEKPDKYEALADLANAANDCLRLGGIVRNLEAFIRDNCGEDRSAFRLDLMRYEALLKEALALREKNGAYVESLRDE